MSRLKKRNLCECGCGQEIRLGNRFIHGHNRTIKENHKNRVVGVCKRCGWLYEIRIGHPRADINNRVEQHHLIMEDYLERYLEPGEIVHHCNEIRDDNRIENLELMLHGKHTSLHHLGSKHTKEAKQKMSIAKIGKVSNRKGKICSEETKRKISQSKKGKKINHKGFVSEETRKKISETLKLKSLIKKERTENVYKQKDKL